jgi:DNA repair protein SbcD/Mre11
VPASLFDGFGYTALGHLHGPQTLGERLRYSGSPLPYSFSEARQHKGSWLVDLDGDGRVQVERVPAPGFRRLSVLRGTLSDLLTSPAHTEHEDDFVSVVLTGTGRPEGAMEQLRRRFPHVLVLTFEPDGTEGDGGTYRSRVKGRDDLAVAAEFVRHVRSSPVSDSERDLLVAAFDAARRAEGED